MTGNQGMFALALALVAVLAVVALVVALPRKPAAGVKETPATTNPGRTTKLVVWISLANGYAWVWCSYILAYLGRSEIAESLSKVAVTEIIAVVLVYALKSLTENLSKNNNWPDKPAVENKNRDA